MRIVIDLQGAQTASRFRGIGRYSLSLAEAIVRNRGDHEIILALNGLFRETIEPIRATFESLLPQKNIRVWEAPGPVDEINDENTWRREAAERIREAFFASLKPDFILLTTLFEGFGDDFVGSVGVFDQSTAIAVIFYDLIPFIYPETYLADSLRLAWYHKKVSYCKRAQLLLSISESSRREAIQYLGVDENNVVNISTASDPKFRRLQLSTTQQNKLRTKFGLSKDFLMYSGATDERKNHLRLIKAYAQLPHSVRGLHQLAFVGKLSQDHRSHFLSHGAKCGLRKGELVVIGQITDDEMIALYNLCKAFVFPSWHEGFGLPALEAMKCGRAVIASNTSAGPEVIGRTDALFDPFDVTSIVEKIEQVLTDDAFRIELEGHGLERSKMFSWDTSARHALAAMENHHNHLGLTQRNIKGLRDDDTLITSLIESIAKQYSIYSEYDLLSSAAAIAQNCQIQNKCQLLVDISELIHRDAQTGIQRVTRSVLCELLKNPPDGLRVEPVYAMMDHGYRYARRFTLGFLDCPVEKLIDEPVEYGAGDIFLGLDLQSHVVPAQRDFFQQMRCHGVQVKFVVYDLLCVLMPQHFVEGASKDHIRWLEVVNESDGVICISKSVADEFSSWMKEHGLEKIRPFNIDWFHLGADVENSAPSYGVPADAEAVLEVLGKQFSFLMVGTIEPRKGHAQVLVAFEQLWAKGVDVTLVIVGKQGWMVEPLIEKLRQHPKQGACLFWLEGISDEYLEKVYAASTCLIAASEGEGFGLPLIEAARYNLPIIARDIPVFREVANVHAFYFSGLDAKSLTQAVQEWLALYDLQKHPTSIDMSGLTWAESAAQLLEVMGISKYTGTADMIAGGVSESTETICAR